MEISEYKNYGKCAVFRRAATKVMVTLDLGPRIIWFGTEDMNFMNEDLERNVSKGGEYFDVNFGEGTKWYLYGGHRVWKSPEDLETYTPDNGTVEYQADEHGGVFVCRAAKRFDYSLEIRLDDTGALELRNTVSYKGTGSVRVAVWGLTVAAKGGVMVLPLNEPADDLNPVQNMVRWPYNELDDERLFVGRSHVALSQTAKENAVKIGAYAEKGRAYYVLGAKTMKLECTPEEGVYGDFWCNFESYTNAHILEVEWLSPQKILSCGESASMRERWSICDTPSGFAVSEAGLAAFE